MPRRRRAAGDDRDGAPPPAASGGAPAEPSPGDVVGGCELRAVVRRGVTSVVYRALDRESGRVVAVEVLAGERAGDPAAREAFARGALAAAAVGHPGVVPAHRAGVDGGRAFVAMRFVDGPSLDDLVARSGPMRAARAARIVAGVAGALAAAHARGLVHGDVRPANVLVEDPDGAERVYLAGFGPGVAAGGDHPALAGGGAGFLAPEQAAGRAPDARADVYALGCLLHLCLAGRPPFTGTDEEVLAAHAEEAPPPLADAAPDAPAALAAAVRRALAKRASNRFAGADAFARAVLSARFDLVLAYDPSDATAAEWLAGDLRGGGTATALAPAGDDRAVAAALAASDACAVLAGTGGLGAWARGALAASRAAEAGDPGFRLAAVLLPGGPHPLDPGLAALAGRPWADLRGGYRGPGAAGDVLRAVRGAAAPGPGDAPPPADRPPYPGRAAFAEADAPYYVGREDDVARVAELLRAGRLALVEGVAGSGRTSLLRAGVLPALRAETPLLRVLDVEPGDAPLDALAAALSTLPRSGSTAPGDLAADPAAVDAVAARALRSRPGAERVVVVVDRLEEAFALCPDPAEAGAFLDALVHAATVPGGRVSVVAALRSDFAHRLAGHRGMRLVASRCRHLLGPPEARALRRMVEVPARLAGLELEPGLAQQVADEAAARPDGLAFLAELMRELWERRRGDLLTADVAAGPGAPAGGAAPVPAAPARRHRRAARPVHDS